MEHLEAQKNLLRWYLAAGVDEAIGERPTNRYAARPLPTQPVSEPASPATALEPRPASPPPRELVPQSRVAQSAAEAAAAAATLEELRDTFAAFEGCALKRTATNFVFADGNPGGRLMFVGEAPGAEEDRQGVPFVGPAGRLLDLMLAAIGLTRGDDTYITNMLPWRPPGNRQPTDAEIAACLPFTARHIELVAPDVLVLVGGTAAKTLLGTSQGIMRLRGRWFEYQTAADSVVPTRAILHPAYLLRSPAQKREAWQDLLAIKARLREAQERAE